MPFQIWNCVELCSPAGKESACNAVTESYVLGVWACFVPLPHQTNSSGSCVGPYPRNVHRATDGSSIEHQGFQPPLLRLRSGPGGEKGALL